MNVKCSSCGYETQINATLIKGLIGGTLLSGAALGWTTYAFAGLLDFYGGAALIAVALLAGGGSVLLGVDLGLVISVGKKITDLLNDKGHRCTKCGDTSWIFTGFRDTEVFAGSDHKTELAAAFRDARTDLYVAPGFLSSYVVNQAFLQELAGVLDRGIKVKLIFAGIESHSSSWMRDGFTQALPHIEAIEAQYANLQLIQKHTHQKGIVVDNRYAIVGSYNFLSNATAQRDEPSLQIYEPDAIQKLCDEFV